MSILNLLETCLKEWASITNIYSKHSLEGEAELRGVLRVQMNGEGAALYLGVHQNLK